MRASPSTATTIAAQALHANAGLRTWLALIASLLMITSPARAEPPHHPKHWAEAPLHTEFNETVDRVPVEVVMIDGKVRSGDITITHFRPAGDGPFPVVVLQHGRAGARRTSPWRWRLLGQSRYWVRRGFAVFVPTRLGYGETGLWPDPERVGACADPSFAPMIRVLVKQTEATLAFAARQPWADARRAIVVGQSQGGLTAVASAASQLSGIIAAVNFSGGTAGRRDRPLEPCAPDRMQERFREAKAWIESDEDKWLFSFVNICQVFQIDPSYLRNGLRRRVAEVYAKPSATPLRRAA